MNTPSLSRITMETMANYRMAATQVVAASGAGSRRLVRAVDGTLQQQVLPRTSKLAPQVSERMDAVRGTVNRYVEQGIDQIVEVAETTITLSGDFAVAQVTRLSDLAGDVTTPLLVDGLHTATRLAMPAAQLALKVSSVVADGATSLADAAGAHPVAKPVRRAAKRTQAAGRAAKQAVAKAPAQVKRAVRQTTAKVGKVAKRAA
jgi:hypothetical protein